MPADSVGTRELLFGRWDLDTCGRGSALSVLLQLLKAARFLLALDPLALADSAADVRSCLGDQGRRGSEESDGQGYPCRHACAPRMDIPVPIMRAHDRRRAARRSEEHTSELQSLMR